MLAEPTYGLPRDQLGEAPRGHGLAGPGPARVRRFGYTGLARTSLPGVAPVYSPNSNTGVPATKVAR